MSAQRLRRRFSELAEDSGAGDRTISTIMSNSPEIIAAHYNAREVSKMHHVTDFVGDVVSKLCANRGLALEKP